MKYIPKTTLGTRLKSDKRYRIVSFAILGFIINLAYAMYNGILGIMSHSVWFITMCVYYIILSVMRFGAVFQERHNISTEIFITRFCGVLLILLSLVLSGSVYLSFIYDVVVKHNEIVMIIIAAYTFYKTTFAIVDAVKVRSEGSLLLSTIRNIGCADAAASILSLQRSMLVSFVGMSSKKIYTMNSLTGLGVFLVITSLGISMIVKKVK